MNKSNTPHSIEDFLTELGLTPKQSKVYLSALQLGPASVQAIANLAKIERTNVYDSIESLIAKRLMSITATGKRTLYVAEPPETLQKILEEKQATLKQLLPDLRSLTHSSDAKPRIRYYDGIEGYKAVYEDNLTCKDKLLFGIYSVKTSVEVLGRDYLRLAIERRVKAGIRLRVIRSRQTEVEGIYRSSEEELREVRFAPEDMVFPITTFVYDDKIVFLSSEKELFGMIIESKDMASAYRNCFQALWQISTPPTF
ncbi:MAG TPA: helix-turn-helix domain-containing protein [Patescibacteria group bacterium]